MDPKNRIRTFKTKIEIDPGKATLIAQRLYNQFYNRTGFFASYDMPEYILPENLEHGSKEHGLYLTYVISIDYMTDAERLWRRSRGTYQLYPEMFCPEKILSLGKDTVRNLVKRLGGRYPVTGADTWKKVSRKLLYKYDGDPRNLTKEPSTIKEIRQRLDEFPYLRGNKLSNFYIRAMGETGLFKITNLHELDIPVDIQVARFTIYTGVLKLLSDSFEGCVHKNPLRGLIEEAWRNSARKIGTSPWKLDEPIWTVGSKLCSKRQCSPCPVKDLCNKTKGVKFSNAIAIWDRIYDQ